VAVHEAPHVRIYAVDFEERVPKAQLQRAEAVLIARQLREMQLRDPDAYDRLVGGTHASC
jgi:hypothetical protein